MHTVLSSCRARRLAEDAAASVRGLRPRGRVQRLEELVGVRHSSPTFSAIQRVSAVSDLHIDIPANWEWVTQLPAQPDTLLIVAGDVSDSLAGLAATFDLLGAKYAAVSYVPGNHDLWVKTLEAKKDRIEDSFSKLLAILELCKRMGVCTGVVVLHRVRVVPLFSWYIRGAGGSANHSLYMNKEGEDAELTQEAWADNYSCVWPEWPTGAASAWGLLPGVEVAQVMAGLNEARIQMVDAEISAGWHGASGGANGSSGANGGGGGDECPPAPSPAVISFSHFLGRTELVMECATERMRRLQLSGKTSGCTDAEPVDVGEKNHDPNVWFNFSRVAGCTLIEAQLRRLGSVCHVHGHQHRQRDRVIDGVRYVSHCLAYPNERAQGLCVAGALPKEIWAAE